MVARGVGEDVRGGGLVEGRCGGGMGGAWVGGGVCGGGPVWAGCEERGVGGGGLVGKVRVEGREGV